jgi:hypothetical protein
MLARGRQGYGTNKSAKSERAGRTPALRKPGAQGELLPLRGSNSPGEEVAGAKLAFYLGDGYRDQSDHT